MSLLPGLEELGSGYDCLNGYYAQSESCTENLFDWSNIPTREVKFNGQTYIIPRVVNFYPKITFEYFSIAGEGLDEYHQSISKSVNIGGEFLGFTGSLETEFGEVVDYSTFRKFSRIQYNYTSHLLHLTSSPLVLRKCLRSEIRDEIDDPKIEPETIFQRYGTHFIHSHKVGGRIVLSICTNKLNYNSSTDLKTIAKAAAEEIFHGNVSNEYKEEVKKLRENSEITLIGCGGNISALGNDMMHPNVNAWIATVPDNPVFITFDRSDSLSFIGDLVDDENRKKQFVNALPIYFDTHRRKFKPFNPPYLEYALVSLTRATGYYRDRGFRPVISEGSKWKWLAVSYASGTSNEHGIVVREKPYAQGLLRPVVKKDYLAYFDLLSVGPGTGYVCQPLTDDPDNFVSLGGFLEYRKGYHNPANIRDLVGVHRSLCVRGEPGEPYIYYGSYGNSKTSSWYISSKEGALDLSAITCSHNDNPRAYIL
ncbi:2804_t:CDS:2 [Acaulospora morrowiae]|uniref:2804_t:CDS:1 n=1 Tax=Acaulospora morrowiae TaxID=94023 RepID=A0A9N8YS75_9GLOM|nr:2804_t:CDS:2 [Acaulospora morrowiae]